MRLRIRRNLRVLLPVLTAALLPLLIVFVPAAHRGAVGVYSTMLRAAGNGVSAVRRTTRGFLPFSRAERSRMKSLEEQVQRLRVDLSRLAVLAEENRELRRRLDIPAPVGWVPVTAPVLARDPLSWDRRFRIGRGRLHGVEPGCPVWGADGVIGRIAAVTQTTALVVTLADPACRYSVRLPRSGGTGVLQGGGGTGDDGLPLCFVDFLPRDLPYRAGEPVITSGLGRWVPEGLPVGSVMQCAPGKLGEIVHTVYTRLRVRPAAEFRWFRYVSVLTRPLPDVSSEKREEP